MGYGTTWTALVALFEEAPLNLPLIDPTQLTPAEREQQARVAALIRERGHASLSDTDLN